MNGQAAALSHAPLSSQTCGVTPLHCLLPGAQTPHFPFLLQKPPLHGVPAAMGVITGLPMLHALVVQSLESVGTSLLSAMAVALPMPSHTMLVQSPGDCASIAAGPEGTATDLQVPLTHIAVAHAIFVGGQSLSCLQLVTTTGPPSCPPISPETTPGPPPSLPGPISLLPPMTGPVPFFQQWSSMAQA